MAKVQTSLRIEEETLKEAKEILASLGMNFSEAVNVFAAMVVQKKGLPFDVKIPEYPPITYEEAKEKVRKSLNGISKKSGKKADLFFDELLDR
ncbi:type II toxin-antitoxin system RelB/DinJ family antitoxin [Hydrogenimonas sp. SS33]|uniref:type II toxin-antitoxin system RelB/DinJ family antitoxin n=1 Tax=Hydrogenimonas leucolamina TaxID=2954236 RepID=UPI00336C241B